MKMLKEVVFMIGLSALSMSLFSQTYRNSKSLMSELGVVKIIEYTGSDTLGNFSSVSFFENGNLVERRTSFAKVPRIQKNIYTEDGNLLSQTYFKGSKIERSYNYKQFVDSTLVFEITGTDTVLSRTDYYCDSLLCASMEYSYNRRTEYNYENGRPLEIKIFNESDNLQSIQEFQYNENGKIEVDQIKSIDGGYFIQHRYLYGFGITPKVEEFLSTDNRGNFWTYFIYEYFENGLIKKITNLDEDNGLYLQSSFSYSFKE